MYKVDSLESNLNCYNSDSDGSEYSKPIALTSEQATNGFDEKNNDQLGRLGADIMNLSDIGSVANYINARITKGLEKGSFLVTNLSPIVTQYNQWCQELPMVHPFYAVKCMPDLVTLRLLSHLGCGFDCATQGEMDTVINGLGGQFNLKSRGAVSNNIVFANPAKMPDHLKYAAENGIRMTVFDGEDELYKLGEVVGHENFQLLLRIETDDKHSVCRFSHKYGASVTEAPHLLRLAHSLGLHVAGVSFHVGSGCGDPNAYITALSHARFVFDTADSLQMPAMHIVDIGGGFPGDSSGYGGRGMPTFHALATSIRNGIALFAEGFTRPMDSVRFIAEPGRYFVSASTTIVTKVYARKGGKNMYQALYVDDGVYGSFNNVVYDHATPTPRLLKEVLATEAAMRSECDDIVDDDALCGSSDEESLQVKIKGCDVVCSHSSDAMVEKCTKGTGSLRNTRDCALIKYEGSNCDVTDATHSTALIPTAVFGPTCDGLDQMCSFENTLLPRCEVGDWLVWSDQGAYTHTAAFDFNGYTHRPQRSYCFL